MRVTLIKYPYKSEKHRNELVAKPKKSTQQNKEPKYVWTVEEQQHINLEWHYDSSNENKELIGRRNMQTQYSVLGYMIRRYVKL